MDAATHSVRLLLAGEESRILEGVARVGSRRPDIELLGRVALGDLAAALADRQPDALILALDGRRAGSGKRTWAGEDDETLARRLSAECLRWLEEDEPIVTVGLAERDDRVVVWIRDIGIDPARTPPDRGVLLDVVRAAAGPALVLPQDGEDGLKILETPDGARAAGGGDELEVERREQDLGIAEEPDAGAGPHLELELHRLALDLRLLLDSLEPHTPEAEALPSWVQGVAVSRGDVLGSFDARWPQDRDLGAAEITARIEALEEEIAEHREAGLEAGRSDSGLLRLAVAFGLERVQARILAAVYAPEIDPAFQRAYSLLQDDLTRPFASEHLLALLGLAPEVIQQAPALRHLLRSGQAGEGGDLDLPDCSRPLRLGPEVIDFLAGRPPAGPLQLYVDSPAGECPIAPRTLERLSDLLIRHLRQPERDLIVHLHGPSGSGRRAAVARACSAAALGFLRLDLARVDAGSGEPAPAARRAAMLARLYGSALMVDGFDGAQAEGPARLAVIEALLDLQPAACFLIAEAPWNPLGELADSLYVDVELEVPAAARRGDLWRRFVPGIPGDLAGDLAAKFRLTPGQIRNAAIDAGNRAAWEGGPPASAALHAACRSQAAHRLEEYAIKIEPRYGWDDIQLPADQLGQLAEITSHVRLSDRVMVQWGLQRKFATGRGVTALFAGSSGTGKTMASEVLASELGLDLFKIDLSRVLSKWLGESEARLREIFDQAESSNAILMFDEADALAARRTEVRDSHDRYANIEVAYLLQRMDEYTGIAVLATNLKRNLDQAFVRRMRFIIDFPVPDAGLRERIWRNLFPEREGDGWWGADVDFGFLASRFELTGGNIRNIALRAAFSAAGEGGRRVGQRHVLAAARRELQKLGRPVAPEDFQPYAGLLDFGTGEPVLVEAGAGA